MSSSDTEKRAKRQDRRRSNRAKLKEKERRKSQRQFTRRKRTKKRNVKPVSQIEELPEIFCNLCKELSEKTPLSFCSGLHAYISHHLVELPWVCSLYESK